MVINEYFNVNKDAKLALAINYGNEAAADKIDFLSVLKVLPEVEKLSIVVSGGKMLESIEEVTYLNDLKEFQLSGFCKKMVSLKPLEKFTNLNKLILDWGVNSAQQKIINKFSNLTLLRLQTLDLSTFDCKSDLRDLTIGHSFKGHNKLSEICPSITALHLTKCNEISDVDFINRLEYLEELTLREMVHLVSFPTIANNGLRKIKLINAVHLESITAMNHLNAIEKLAITGIRHLKATDFITFKNKPTLKTLYAQFDDSNEAEKFDDLANKNGWINSMLNW